MLSDIFKPFIEGSPLSVMMRGLVERLLNPEQMDQWFEQFAQEQYTRELLFSTVVSLMLEVVCGSRKAVNAAYQWIAQNAHHQLEADTMLGLVSACFSRIPLKLINRLRHQRCAHVLAVESFRVTH